MLHKRYYSNIGLGWEEQLCNEVGTTVGELLPTTVLSYIYSSGAIDIHAKTCQK